MQAATLSLADNQQFPFSRALDIRMCLHFNRLLKGQGSSPRLLTPRARAELELLSSWESGPGSPSLPLLTQLGQGKVCAFHAHKFLWRTAVAAADKLSCSTGAQMLAIAAAALRPWGPQAWLTGRTCAQSHPVFTTSPSFPWAPEKTSGAVPISTWQELSGTWMPGDPFSGSLASFLTCSIVVVAVALRPQHPQIVLLGIRVGLLYASPNSVTVQKLQWLCRQCWGVSGNFKLFTNFDNFCACCCSIPVLLTFKIHPNKFTDNWLLFPCSMSKIYKF